MRDSTAAKYTIPVFRPYADEEEIAAVAEVLRSGWWGQGPKTEAFEKSFAAFVGADRGVALNSATAGLYLSLEVVGIRGFEVITPALTFVATNHAILQAGGTPVFADVDPETLNIDPADVSRKVTERTKAIMVVHFGGHAVDLDAIHAIADQHNLIVIEDAAHAIGATYKGKPIGGLSPLTCFSFHPTKNIGTGDGGMVMLPAGSDPEWEARLRRLRWLGITKDSWQRSTPGDASQFRWEYRVEEVGQKFHFNDIMAAIALIQLKRVRAGNARRREIWQRYNDAFADVDWITCPVEKEYTQSSCHFYVIRVDNRDELRAWLRSRGIATGLHYVPSHLYDVYVPYRTDLPVTDTEWKRLITLPLFPGLQDDEIAHIIESVKRFQS